MLKRIHLENFKACKDVDIRLAPLTVLAGLNSSGKSTILQSIAFLRQNYNRPNGGIFSLNGELVELGEFRDILSETAEQDELKITVQENEKNFPWILHDPFGNPESNELHPKEIPPGIDYLVGAGGSENVPNFLKRQFQFLSANRIMPKTFYPQVIRSLDQMHLLGTHGEYTADVLVRNENLSVSEKRSYSVADINIDADLLSKVSFTHSLLDQTAAWLQKLSPGIRLNANRISGTDEVRLKYRYKGVQRDSHSNFYRPTNVGFGLTYCLPIIVACLAAPQGALLLLENPEAHLHPQGQAALGELLALCTSDGVQIIVETHSDHLLNGIRLAVKRKQLETKDVVLHFFTRDEKNGEVFVQSPAILETGRLSNWPDGFFDEWDKSLDALLD